MQLLVSMGMAVFLQASNRCTERGVPAVIRWGYCITSFIACLAWIDLLAEESVALLEVSIRKRSFLAPFDTRDDHLTKTGSGQTWGKQHSKER